MIDLIDPRSSGGTYSRALAARRPTGELRRVGFLSNEEEFMRGALHFPRYTRLLARVLEARLGITDFHWEAKPLLSRAADVPQLERLRHCDAVVNGLAK